MNLAKANCTENHVCTSCDKVVLDWNLSPVFPENTDSFALIEDLRITEPVALTSGPSGLQSHTARASHSRSRLPQQALASSLPPTASFASDSKAAVRGKKVTRSSDVFGAGSSGGGDGRRMLLESVARECEKKEKKNRKRAKRVIRKREVKQLLVRGENVMLIAKKGEDDEKMEK